MNNYDVEARQRWGNTAAYAEHQAKTADYTADKWQQVNDGLNNVFAKFAECKQHGNAPEAQAAQVLVKELQDYITENYYTCTIQILVGLGQLYTADERFRENIDKHGTGTAEFASEAIKIYCK